MLRSTKSNRFTARYAGGGPRKTMDEQEFRTRADQALEDLYRRLSTAGERHEFEADFNAGALVIEFEDPPAKFVVSPNAPVSQVWVSAQMRSFKLDWDPSRNAFVLPDSGQTLVAMMASAIGQQIG